MDIRLPRLGEGADSGTVSTLFLKVGDPVKKDQAVLELESEKAVASIPSPSTGTITEIYVKEGDLVKTGDLIMSLNKSVFEAQLRIAEIQAKSGAAIDVATADCEVARERYNKLSQLQRSGTAHSSEVIQARAEVTKAEGRLQIAREERSIAEFRVAEIKAQIERRLLRSPIDGVVLELNRDLAESAAVEGKENEKEAALARIAQLDKLRLVVHLPAYLLGGLKIGDGMRVLILTENSLRAHREGSGTEVAGVLEFLSPAIDPSSETVRARIVIDNREGRIRSGSHALVLLPRQSPGSANP